MAVLSRQMGEKTGGFDSYKIKTQCWCNKMNILVISNIEWSDANAFGNTVSNFFVGFDAEFSCVYRRSSMPNNSICQKYYTITTKDCLKNIFAKENIGRQFDYADTITAQTKKGNHSGTERKLIGFMHRFGLSFLRDVDDWLFCCRRWDNHRFRWFIESVKPDVVFTFISPSKPILQLLEAVKRYSPGCKIIASVVDDVYGVSRKAKRRCIEKQIEMCNRLYGASEEICTEYGKLFNRTFAPLYKGCTFENHVVKKSSKKIHFVYAGNLYYGRAETLAALAAAIVKHNQTSSSKVELCIYTATEVSDKLRTKLHINGASMLCSSKPYAEIKKIMQDAHVVLHVESFEPKQIEVVKYSFSTKLIDCLQSGSVMMAIGPESIASIRYAAHVPGAVCVTDLAMLDGVVDALTTADLFSMAQATRQFAIKNHDAKELCRRLVADFAKTICEDEMD